MAGVVGGFTAMKPRKKVELGEGHVWLLEAERVVPGLMAMVVVAMMERTRVRNRRCFLRNMFDVWFLCFFVFGLVDISFKFQWGV